MNSSFNFKKINRMPFFTFSFLVIQIVIYLLMELMGVRFGIMSGSENAQILYQFGALLPQAISEGHEYWRLVTPIFVHIGIMHLAVNSLSLYFVGRLLEPIIGHTRFFVLYIFSGIMGNALSFAFSNPYTISAGASTSIFGLFAAFIILGKIYTYHPVIRQMSRNMTLLILLNLFTNLFSSGVDMLGHIGGIIGGILLMIALGVPKHTLIEKLNIHKQIASGIFFVFLLITCVVYGLGIF